MIKIESLQESIGKLVLLLKSGELSHPLIMFILGASALILFYLFPIQFSLNFDSVGTWFIASSLFVSYGFKYILIYFLNGIKRLNKELSETENNIDEINIIEKKVKNIYKFIKIIHILTKLSLTSGVSLSKYNTIKINPYFRNFYQNECEFISKILLDLQSDLKVQIIGRREVLEQAKSELEKNIHGTTELDSISELQKARLDRQIEQFEELQRVLVKV